MRDFSIVARIGKMGIAQYHDNKKYTFIDLKSGKLAYKEFKKIKFDCTFPFEKNKSVEHAEYYDLSKYDIIDDDGHYTITEHGDFILDDDMYDSLYMEMVKQGADKVLKHLDFKNFEPGSTKMSITVAAINSYLDNLKRISINVEKLDEKVADYVVGYEQYTIFNIVSDKQKEYKQYLYDILNEDVKLDDEEYNISKPVNIIDFAFDKDVADLLEREQQL